jgi:hemolysin III
LPDNIIREYTPLEERLHALSHGVAAIVALIAFVMLMIKTSARGEPAALIAAAIYGVTMLGVFVTSTLYHAATLSPHRGLYKLLDHIAIYFKISGGFTLYAVVLLPFNTALWLLAWTWGATLLGTLLKVRAYRGGTGKKFNLASLLFYLGMGSVGLLIVDQLYALMPREGFYWLVAGALSYSLGTIFYAMKSRAYTHTIWHLFVIGGSAGIFISIYGYVI